MHKSILVISIMLLSFFSKTVSAQYDAEVFFKNLKFIIAASEANNNYASLKGELLSPPTWKRKIYSSTIKLSEFESTLTEIDSVLFFEAVSINFQVKNAKYLLDQKVRDGAGMAGYVNEVYTGDSPALQDETFEAMTLLRKEGATRHVVVLKRRGGAGYRICLIR